MKPPSQASVEDPRTGQSRQGQRLAGRPLASRATFLAKRSALVLLCLVLLAGAILLALKLEGSLFKGVGWAALAIVAAVAVEVLGEGVFEIPRAFSYGRYRERWEAANGVDS